MRKINLIFNEFIAVLKEYNFAKPYNACSKAQKVHLCSLKRKVRG
jgi:hypothetical protein